MSNLLDYLLWRGDLSFQASPFNDVDNLVFCALSYIGFDKAADWANGETILLKDAAQWFSTLPAEAQHIRSPLDQELLRLAGNSARFRHVRLARYEDKFSPEAELQFSATTFLIDDETAYVAFRGTDSTLVGWKEDFNMAFLPLVPAQTEAAAYLNGAGTLPQRRLLVGGHSKGGNLAVYAAAKCASRIQDCICAVYSNDGPGFYRELLDSPQYKRVQSRVHALVPQSSIVGRLLELDAQGRVVHSTENGIQQHDPYTWEVLGAQFVWEDGVDVTSLVIDQSLKTWLEEMAPEEREEFINQIYAAMQATNVKTLREFSKEKAKNSAVLFRVWREAPQETRKFMIVSAKKLINALRIAVAAQFKVKGSEKLSELEEKARRMEDFLRRMEEETQADHPEE